ncbi:DUF4192 domain-containing protein [Streptomyces sp. NPDC050560]|uniref:DUF4192 domain-containing protein n=1 Tax=Streptomyces sp. NPDC050560 TaxID=3365630 RepID=UPI0037A270D8
MTHRTDHLGPLNPDDPNHPRPTTEPPARLTPRDLTNPVHPPGPGTLPTPDWAAVTVEDTAEDDPHDHMEPVTLHSAADLADALPYLLGYQPEECMVLAAVHSGDGPGKFGARARLGLPRHQDDWPEAARHLAHTLIDTSARRRTKPDALVVFLCDEPPPGGTGRDVMRYLRPLAQLLRTACGDLDVPVVEALCISDGRFWSYCCAADECCPTDGTPLGVPGTSVLAAAAAYAGLRVRGSLKTFHARLLPRETGDAAHQENALDSAALRLVPGILSTTDSHRVAVETLTLARQVLRRLATAIPAPTDSEADRRDDALLTDDEAAALLLGLQDRTTRDYAARWTEQGEGPTAIRLWRALARRCVGAYGEHAAAPLTLVGWVAWTLDDELEAREALAMALGANPDYLFARLLHQACNEGLTPDAVRECLRDTTLRTPEGEEITLPDGLLPTPRTATPSSLTEAPTHPTATSSHSPDASTTPATPQTPQQETAHETAREATPPRGTAPTTRDPGRPRRPAAQRSGARNGRAGTGPKRRSGTCRPPTREA